ncbi:unnamed protein product, partial [Chrysoparadoxa australica]
MGGLEAGFAEYVQFRAAFDNDPAALATHEMNLPEIERYNLDLYEKSAQERFLMYPKVDLWVTGPPCQDWVMNQEGKRAELTLLVADLITRAVAQGTEPTLLVLEQSSKWRRGEIFPKFHALMTMVGYENAHYTTQARVAGVCESVARSISIYVRGQSLMLGDDSSSRVSRALRRWEAIVHNDHKRFKQAGKPAPTVREVLRCVEPAYTFRPWITGGQSPYVRSTDKPCPKILANSLDIPSWYPPHEKDVTDEPSLIRKLTVDDALLLASFPPWWKLPDGISKTAAMQLIANAVPYAGARYLARTLS